MSSDPASLLRARSLHVTAQRLAVLRAVADRPHCTAEEVAEAVPVPPVVPPADWMVRLIELATVPVTVRGNAEAYAPLTDDYTGFPITAENVVVIFVPHIFANTYNSEDEVYNIDLIDYGNAIVYRDGLAIPAYWIRAEENQPLLLTTLTGDPIFLRPGKTFYQVMGTTSTYTNNGTEWRFEFRTP